MSKLITILLIALVFEAIGVVFLSHGLKQLGSDTVITPRQIPSLIQRGATNPSILLGVFFEAVFFVGLLVLMSRAEVSLIWPLTSLGFVITTLAAKFFLHEQVTALRWAGVVLVVAGAALISWSEQQKPAAPASQWHEEGR